MKKTIIWDFDNTLFNTKELYFGEFIWNHSQCGQTRQECLKEWKKVELNEIISIGKFLISSGMIKYAQPIPGAISTLNYLAEKYDQKCLTARPKYHAESVEYLINKYLPGIFSDIHYFNSLESKIDQAYKNMNGIILIDDTLKSFKGIQKTNYTGILFGSHKKDNFNSQIKVARNMEEIPSIIEEISQKYK